MADTWTLIDSLAHVAEDIVATSPWLLRTSGEDLAVGTVGQACSVVFAALHPS